MKNWRTTLVGAILAALTAAKPILDAWQGGPIDWRALVISAALAVLGFLAKDAGVTGAEK